MSGEHRYERLIARLKSIGDVDQRELNTTALTLFLNSAPEQLVSEVLDWLNRHQISEWDARDALNDTNRKNNNKQHCQTERRA